MAYPILPIAAFLGAVFVLIPLPSHWRARNYATISLVCWLFVVDIIYGINSVVWSDNVRIKFLVWCDITTKLIIGASIALPASAMCICKHLESVTSGRIICVSHGDRRRRMFFELAMCVFLPVVIMALHYVVQGHRFDIVEAFGCQPATYYSIPAVFIVWFPPLLLATVSMTYACLALFHFVRHRVAFAAVLHNANSSITPNRYLRLMALAMTQVVWQVILTVLPMYDNIASGLRPWTNWADVHSDWLRVDPYRLNDFVPGYRHQLFLFFFVMPASSILFFLFFGFGEQAMKDYRQTVYWIRCKIFKLRPLSQEKTAKNGMILHSGVSLPSPSAHNKTRFGSDDGNSLPAYSPSSDPAHFGMMFKGKTKEALGDPHMSDVSLDRVTIPTIRAGELSPTESSATSEYYPFSEGDLRSDDVEHSIGVPIVANQLSLVSPPPERPAGGLPVPPRSPTHRSRFFADNSEIACMV